LVLNALGSKKRNILGGRVEQYAGKIVLERKQKKSNSKQYDCRNYCY
jgi:hypothetical protein